MGVFDIAKRVTGVLNPGTPETTYRKPGTDNMGRSTPEGGDSTTAALSGQAGTPKGYKETGKTLAMKAQVQKKKQVDALKAKRLHDNEVRTATSLAESQDEQNDPAAGRRAALEKA
jgi:hypothetical protein